MQCLVQLSAVCAWWQSPRPEQFNGHPAGCAVRMLVVVEGAIKACGPIQRSTVRSRALNVASCRDGSSRAGGCAEDSACGGIKGARVMAMLVRGGAEAVTGSREVGATVTSPTTRVGTCVFRSKTSATTSRAKSSDAPRAHFIVSAHSRRRRTVPEGRPRDVCTKSEGWW